MTALRSVAWGLVLAAWSPWMGSAGEWGRAWAAEPVKESAPPAAKALDKPAAKPGSRTDDKPAPKFIRVKKDDRAEVVALETSVVRYTADPAKRPGVSVDLIGAIHVGDRAYYERLNKLFTDYEAVLYELVAPEGTRVPKEGRPSGNGHPVGALQNGLKSLLDLDHQLDCVDYTVKNLVHADMSPDEFAKRMTERNEGWLQMALRMMGQSAAAQGRESQRGGEAKMLLALFAKDRPLRLKRIMAEQMADTEGALAALDGPDGGSTIISERNKKALTVLTREVDAGKKRLAIFYGAGHLPDFEKRLTEELGYKRGDERWLPAWSLMSVK